MEHQRPNDDSEKLTRFLALLVEWNKSIRLTGSTDTAALARHVAEAETMLPFLPTVGHVVDIGSGGGFPGIILAINRPQQRFTLVEPIAKKVAFLNTCRRNLKLQNVEVLRARDDQLDQQPHFDIATSQATFAPAEWFRRAPRLLRRGGTVLALLGPNADELPPEAVVHGVQIGGQRDRRIAVLVTHA